MAQTPTTRCSQSKSRISTFRYHQYSHHRRQQRKFRNVIRSTTAAAAAGVTPLTSSLMTRHSGSNCINKNRDNNHHATFSLY
ncbi:hypothetical protein EC957_011507 [Mortierella hygrophila]|uniref:Uncharacterized protein n=1 Tax=Mortierella hygrophila TaxID=979708 RepID=A0A9P6F9M6_9FUNG|nr:hypothetical protein EC957_011507 [Mortierella hygrophila]